MNNAMKWLLTAALVPLALACPAEPPPAPEVPKSATVRSFTATPSEISPEETTTLSWEVENAKSVSISTTGGVPVELAEATRQQGTVEVKPEASTVYVLTARGEGGHDTAAVAVVVTEKGSGAPLFTAVPAEIRAGEPVTLVWNVPGSERVTITAGAETVHTSDKASGSVSLVPNDDVTYVLTAGSVTLEVSVSVEPGVLSFTSSVAAAHPGAPVALQWRVGGAIEVTLSSPGRGILFTSTESSDIADGSFEDTVPADLPANGYLTYELVAVGPQGEESMKSIGLYVGVDPVFEDLQFPEYALEGSTFSFAWRTLQADRVEVILGNQVVYQSTDAAAAVAGSHGLTAPELGALTEVTLRATNARGGETTITRSVEGVGMPVLVDFQADQTTFTGGTPVTLSWEVTNARHAQILADGKVVAEFDGAIAAQGSAVVYPNRKSNYVLVADNTVGHSVSSLPITMTVTSPARLDFSPEPVPVGATSNLIGHSIPGGGAILGLPNLVKNDPSASFIDISSTGFEIARPVAYDTYSLPNGQSFTMTYFGKPVTVNQLVISEYGTVVLGNSGGGTTSNSPFPTTSLYPYTFAPLWDDLDDDNSSVNSRTFIQVDGTGQSQRLIVQWTDLVHNGDKGKVTFQVQAYADGRVVFAYGQLLSQTLSPSVGLVNSTETEFVYTNDIPQSGDTYTMFGPVDFAAGAAPVPLIAQDTPRWVQVEMPNGGFIEVDANPRLLPADAVLITEVMYNPTLADGEWFELSNFSADPVDLQGWKIDFGGGKVYDITSSLILPANGRIVLGQTPSSAEDGTPNGAPVALAYGNTFTMPNTSGSVSLIGYGVTVTKASWSTAGTAGTSLQTDTQRGLRFNLSTTTSANCPSTAAFGASGQMGTPGAAHPRCFPWALSRVADNGFQSIMSTGTPIFTSTTLNGSDSVYPSVDFTAAGGRAVKIGNALFGSATAKLTVSSNGWVGTMPSTYSASYGSSGKTPSTGAPNGVFAIFWDDLAGNEGTPLAPSGVYWQQFDPDGVPGNADDYTLISWENWRHYASSSSGNTSNLNFQIKFLEASGDVEYHYGVMEGTLAEHYNGTDATAWIESTDGTTALAIGSDEPWMIPHAGWRFTYIP